MKDAFGRMVSSNVTKAVLEKKAGCTSESIRFNLYTEACCLCLQIWDLKNGKY